MKLRPLILAAAIVLIVGCNEKNEEMTNNNNAKEEVFAAHEKRRLATINGEAKTVDSMMTDDLTFTHANAVVENKAQFIEALETRRLQYQAITDEDTLVRIHGDTGVVSGTCRILVDASGTLIDIRVRYSELWVKEDGNWKMLLWHATEVI